MGTQNKNILIILNNELDKIGGVETYNKKIIEILTKYYDIDDIDIVIFKKTSLEETERSEIINNVKINYIFLPSKISLLTLEEFEKLSFLAKIHYDIKLVYFARKTVYNLVKNKKYRIILDSTSLFFPKICMNNNYFLIQHFNLDIYFKTKDNLIGLKKKLEYLYNSLILKRFNKEFKKIKNLVVYDSNNATICAKYTKAKIYEIALFSDLEGNLFDLDQRKQIIFLGRIDGRQKRVDLLLQINKKLNNLIHFYGKIELNNDKKLIEEMNENKTYGGYIENSWEKKKTMEKYKFLILYSSSSEGFSFSLVEALSLGIPIIVKNSFVSASFLCNEQTGLLLPSSSSLYEDEQAINNFYQMDFEIYKKYCENALNFYRNNLAYSIFETRWKDIFNVFLLPKKNN